LPWLSPAQSSARRFSTRDHAQEAHPGDRPLCSSSAGPRKRPRSQSYRRVAPRMVGGRNDLVIEPNIMRRPAPNPARRPAPEWKLLPPAPTRRPLVEPAAKNLHHNLEKLTRRLEAELRGSPPNPPSQGVAILPASTTAAAPRHCAPQWRPPSFVQPIRRAASLW
jgi:hypothetical protein